MAKSFDELVKRTTAKKTQARAARRTQELLAELLLSGKRQELYSACRSPDTAAGLGCEPDEHGGGTPAAGPFGRQGFCLSFLEKRCLFDASEKRDA
jgi:hypothetical protein